MSVVVKLPTGYFPDPDQGRPVALGSVYIGNVNTDPTVLGNRKSVALLQEDKTEVTIAPASQPLSLNAGGVFTYSGSVVQVKVSGNYSMTVLDSDGVQQYYFPNSSLLSSGSLGSLSYTNGAANSLAAATTGAVTGDVISTVHYDSNMVVFSGGSFQATGTTTIGKAGNCPDADGYFYDVDGKQFEVVGAPNVLQFGAIGDGVANDTTAIAAAFLTSANALEIPDHLTFLVTGDSISRSSSITLTGKGTLKLASSVTSVKVLNFTGANSIVEVDGPTIDINQPTGDGWTNIALNVDGVATFNWRSGRIVNSASSAFPAANNGYGAYLLGAYGDITIADGVHFERIRYCVITHSSSTGRDIKIGKISAVDIAGDVVEINVPSGSCEAVQWIGGTVRNVGSNNTGRGFGFGASGDVKRVIVGGIDFDGVDNQSIHIEDGVREVIILPCTHNAIGTGAAITFGAAISIAGSTAIDKVRIGSQMIKGAAGSDYGIYCGGSATSTVLVIDDQIIDGIGNGPGLFIGSVWQRVKLGNILVKNSNGAGVQCFAKYVEYSSISGYDDQDTPTQTYALSLSGDVIQFQGGSLNLGGNINRGIGLSGAAITMPITLSGSQIDVVEDVIAAASSNSADTPVLYLGDGTYGVLTYSVKTGANYAVRMYTIDWDGTTLTATEISSSASGTAAISATPSAALTMSSNYLRGKYYNSAGSESSVRMTMQFQGLVLFK